MTKNIGGVERSIRIILGVLLIVLSLMGVAVSKMIILPLVLGATGAFLLGTAFVGY